MQKDETLEIVVIHRKGQDHIPEDPIELKVDPTLYLNNRNSNGVNFAESAVPVIKQDLLDDDNWCSAEQEGETRYFSSGDDSPLLDGDDDGEDVHDIIAQDDMAFYDDQTHLIKQAEKKLKKKKRASQTKRDASCRTDGDPECLKSKKKTKNAKHDTSAVKKRLGRPSKFPMIRKNELGVYKCPVCPVEYRTQHNALQHYSKYHQDPVNVSCQHCPLAFKYKVDLDIHCDLVHNDGSGKHVCTKCGMVFQMKVNLRRHEKQKHVGQANKRIHCQFCDHLYFANFEERKQHLIDHHRDQVLVCSLCPRVYETEKSMMTHVKNKHKDIVSSLISCQHCNKEFWLTKSLLYHMDEAHEDQETHVEKPFVCSIEYCQQRFRLPEFLQRHARQHEVRKAAAHAPRKKVAQVAPINEETSPCSTCGKLIPKSKMSDHLKSHNSQPQLFQCKDCDKSYTSKKKLKDHRFSKHTNLTLVCPIQTCLKVFKSRAVLKNHLAGVHGDKTANRCDRCDKCFAFRGDLNVHKKKVHENQMLYFGV